MIKYNLLKRQHREVNNDPQRRCYNGCHFSTEIVQDPWEVLQYSISETDKDDRLKFWVELNDYAVSQRGLSSKVDYRLEISKEQS